MTVKSIAKILLVFLLAIVGLGAGLFGGIRDYPRHIFHEKAKASSEKFGNGQWVHLRKLVGAEFREIVRPNQDTIYSSVFVDLSEGPKLLSIPAINSYYSFAIYNEDTDVIGYVASRTHGTGKPQEVLITPPGYRGDTGAHEVIASSSEMVWVLGRFLISEEGDYPVVHQVQNSLKLSSFTK
ncbi:DUF1254 domain-containing protein [Sneathiella sp. P13V-1]|uniref:DUF1254 domain-containing protein n=1 Tax=Sneathiella sp. P13V-1 TaxID=2697366 RepID=UPI00187B83A8|nr:DUF1254 domain-containing protein [Sneathiella sp. P13V-1]MBE7635928.1 DUF1254 domain-containing protein [Sneathiella sp. P13V-1]